MKSEKKKKTKAVVEPIEVKEQQQQSDNECTQSDGDGKPGEENPCMYNFELL